MVRKLQVHRSRRGFAVDLDLQGLQGGLVGLGGEAQGEAGIDGSQAGSIGRDETLRCGEVRGEGERGQIRRDRQGAD